MLLFLLEFFVLDLGGFFKDGGDVFFLLGEFLTHLGEFLGVLKELGFVFLFHFFDLGDETVVFF